MSRTFKVTVYEKITECFDCEIEIDDDTLTGADLDDALAEAIEDQRVNGDDKRCFVSVDDVDCSVYDE